MQAGIGKVQASAVGDQRRIEIRLYAELGRLVEVLVAAGPVAPAGTPGCP